MLALKDKEALCSVEKEHLVGLRNRRLLVWSLLNVEEFLDQVKT